MSMTPVISIIIAVQDNSSTLQNCITSVTNQNYPYKEIIIKDGGSVDGSLDILKSNNDKITYWESSPDDGIYHAWNIALKHTKGEWICFLGSDDYFTSNNILEKISLTTKSANLRKINIIYGITQIINKSGKIIDTRGQPWENNRNMFRSKKMTIPHPSCFYHRDVFLKHGLFDESFKISGDYELLLRELKTNDALFIPEVLTIMNSSGISNNPSYLLLSLKEDFRALEKHKLVKAKIWFFSQYVALLCAGKIYNIMGEKYARMLLDLYRIILLKDRKWTV